MGDVDSRAPAEDSAADPFTRHREEATEALRGGDAGELKRLYRRFGAYLEEAATDTSDVPLLSYPETAEIVAAHVPPARLILDAGCGPNPAVALQLARRPHTTVVALDIGEGMVRLARRVAEAESLRVLPVVGDAESLPFRDSAFGALVCDDTIEHLPDDRAAVSEIARVLRPLGTAVAATPNRVRLDVLRSRIRDLVRGKRRSTSDYFAAETHLREYTPGEFRSLFAEVFDDARLVPNGYPGGRLARMATAALRVPPLSRLSRLSLVVARSPRPLHPARSPAPLPRPPTGRA